MRKSCLNGRRCLHHSDALHLCSRICVYARAGAHPTDVRMTTRFKAGDLTEGLTGAVHETGHALYEQGRNLAYDGLPVNQAR